VHIVVDGFGLASVCGQTRTYEQREMCSVGALIDYGELFSRSLQSLVKMKNFAYTYHFGKIAQVLNLLGPNVEERFLGVSPFETGRPIAQRECNEDTSTRQLQS